MSDSKIQIKVGHVEFSGEGNQEWLADQLDKILGKVPELLKIEVANTKADKVNGSTNINNGKVESGIKLTTLVTFLKEKNALTNQITKFLATAAYLQLNGKNRLNTSDITKALKDSNQGRLGNASEALNQNVRKGHCEKDGGSQFFVTSEGLTQLGIQS